jgi:IPT/TIG domain-containing protein/matrixin
MKATMKNTWVWQAAAVGALLAFALPSTLVGFTLIGGSLAVGTTGNGYQRDFRVFNNFGDATANNNTTPNGSFPGALGVFQAVWKAGSEWDSNVAFAAKNFDYDWQGAATAVGTVNDNVLSSLQATCGGGTLAFTETGDGISNGWRIRFCEEWTWDDGPGSVPGNNIDIQGVAAHELGHALGMGHSNTGCNGSGSQPIMCAVASGNGTGARTIKPDDAAGLQAIYGAIPSNKPFISSLGGSTTQGQTLVLNGSNFAATVNVKFTAGTTQNTGTIPGVVFNVASTNGGTQVSVTVPASAQRGNVFVWEPALGLLSNGFPIDIGASPPTLMSVSPNTGRLAGGEQVDVIGTNLSDTATVTFNGVDAPVVSRTGSTTIRVATPPGPGENVSVDVRVSQSSGSATLTNGFTYVPNPFTIEIIQVDAHAGGAFTMRVLGRANGEYALCGSDGGGPWTPLPANHPEFSVDLGPRPPFTLQIYARSFGPGTSPNLNASGVALVNGTLPGTLQPLSHYFWQAVYPGATFSKSNQLEISIVP